MSLNRHNPKRDANEPEIIQHLETLGAIVWPISCSGIPDLLVLWNTKFYLLEVKSEKGVLTHEQSEFFALARAFGATNLFVVRNFGDVVEALGI